MQIQPTILPDSSSDRHPLSGSFAISSPLLWSMICQGSRRVSICRKVSRRFGLVLTRHNISHPSHPIPPSVVIPRPSAQLSALRAPPSLGSGIVAPVALSPCPPVLLSCSPVHPFLVLESLIRVGPGPFFAFGRVDWFVALALSQLPTSQLFWVQVYPPAPINHTLTHST